MELGLERLFQAGGIPLLLETPRRDVLAHVTVDHVPTHRVDGLRDVARLQQFVALLVNDLALVVGDVVVFEQVLANVEIAGLDLALGVLDRARHPAMLDRLAFGHLQPLHDRRDAV